MAFLQFAGLRYLVQCEGQIAGHLVEQVLFFGVPGVCGGNGGRQDAPGHTVICQAARQTGASAVVAAQGAVGAIRRGVADHKYVLICQCLDHALRELPAFEALAQALEPAVEPRCRCGRHRPFRPQPQPPGRLAAQQGDPGVVISHGFGQIHARLLDQAPRVVFGHDQLVDFADGQHHLLQVRLPGLGLGQANH